MNQVNLIGRLGADPELRALPSGESVANLRLATSERWKDKDSGEQRERTEWHRIAVFGKVADVLGEHCRKGQELAFSNLQIRTRKWQDKDGNERYTTELHFGPKSGFEFLRRPAGEEGQANRPRDNGGQQDLPGTDTGRPNLPKQGQSKPQSQGAPSSSYMQPGSDNNDMDDDIPF
jgi:single-strand DNA-binding protein